MSLDLFRDRVIARAREALPESISVHEGWVSNPMHGDEVTIAFSEAATGNTLHTNKQVVFHVWTDGPDTSKAEGYAYELRKAFGYKMFDTSDAGVARFWFSGQDQQTEDEDTVHMTVSFTARAFERNLVGTFQE